MTSGCAERAGRRFPVDHRFEICVVEAQSKVIGALASAAARRRRSVSVRTIHSGGSCDVLSGSVMWLAEGDREQRMERSPDPRESTKAGSPGSVHCMLIRRRAPKDVELVGAFLGRESVAVAVRDRPAEPPVTTWEWHRRADDDFHHGGLARADGQLPLPAVVAGHGGRVE